MVIVYRIPSIPRRAPCPTGSGRTPPGLHPPPPPVTDRQMNEAVRNTSTTRPANQQSGVRGRVRIMSKSNANTAAVSCSITQQQALSVGGLINSCFVYKLSYTVCHDRPEVSTGSVRWRSNVSAHTYTVHCPPPVRSRPPPTSVKRHALDVPCGVYSQLKRRD